MHITQPLTSQMPLEWIKIPWIWWIHTINLVWVWNTTLYYSPYTLCWFSQHLHYHPEFVSTYNGINLLYSDFIVGNALLVPYSRGDGRSASKLAWSTIGPRHILWLEPIEWCFGKPDCMRNFSLLMNFNLGEGHAQWRDESHSAPQCILSSREDHDRLWGYWWELSPECNGKVDANCIRIWAVYQNRFVTSQPHLHPSSIVWWY